MSEPEPLEPLAPPDPLPIAPPHVQTSLQRRGIAMAEVLLCSDLPTQFLIGDLLRTAGWGPQTQDDPLTLGFAVALTMIDTVVLIGLMVALTRAHGQSPAALWLGNRPRGREAALGLALVPFVFLGVGLVMTALMHFLPMLHDVATNPIEQLGTGGALNAAILGVIAIVAGGVREELQRAFLLQRFEQHLGGTVLGVVILSVAFGLGHKLQGWDAVVTTGLLGAFWAILYVRRRSSVAPIVSHAGFNALEVLRVAIGGA